MPSYKTIHACVENDDLKGLKDTLQANDPINAVGKSGWTPLQQAVVEGKLDMVKALLEAGADVKLKNHRGDSILHYAFERWYNMDIIKMLVEYGADVDEKNSYGETPLYLSVSQDKGDEAFNYLIEMDVDVNAIDNRDNTSLLHEGHKHIGIVKKLVEKGLDVNDKDEKGNTALHYAITKCKDIDIIKFLIESGADIHAKNNEGKTPLVEAIKYGRGQDRPEAVKILIESGADISYKVVNNLRNNGETLLITSMKRTEPEDDAITKMLIESGIDIDLKWHDGDNMLHYLSRKNDKGRLAKALIDAGVDIEGRNDDNYTPLYIAVRNNYLAVAKTLLECGADIHAKPKDDGDWTPYQLAERMSSYGRESRMLKLLNKYYKEDKAA